MKSFDYERHVLALNDVELEKLVRKWADYQVDKKYKSSMRYGGAGDLGRDVIGFYTDQKHEGEWDNYQCKQYGKTLPTDEGMCELGKILYFAHENNFTVPKNYYFVAPRGINKNLKGWILNPTQLKTNLVNQWDHYCRYKITNKKNEEVCLTYELEQTINSFDFSSVQIIDVDTIVFDSAFRHILVDEFGGDLLCAPDGEVPEIIHDSELIYVNKVLDVYSEYDQITYSKPEDIAGHEYFEDDFIDQRERFYSAEAFRAFYRDNTVEGVLSKFEKEIKKGIKPTLLLDYPDSFQRMCTVLSEAGKLQPSGKLAIHGKVEVKQGYCHHFANENALNWRKK